MAVGGADGQRERRHGHRREAEAASQAASAEPHVLHKLVEPAPAPRPLGRPPGISGTPAECGPRPPAARPPATCPCAMFCLCFEFQVQVQFLLDVLLRAAPTGPREKPHRAAMSAQSERPEPGNESAAGSSRLLDDEIYRAGQTVPQAATSRASGVARPGAGQRVELRLPAGLGRSPVTCNPASFLEAVESRIEGALLHSQERRSRPCWMRLAMAQPCFGWCSMVRRNQQVQRCPGRGRSVLPNGDASTIDNTSSIVDCQGISVPVRPARTSVTVPDADQSHPEHARTAEPPSRSRGRPQPPSTDRAGL